MHGNKMMKRVIVLTHMGLLVALQVVLSRFFSINAWNFKIGFSFLPIAVAGMLLAFVQKDWIELTALLGGLVWGFFLHKKQTNGRIL